MNIKTINPYFRFTSTQKKENNKNITNLSAGNNLHIQKHMNPTFCKIPDYKVVDMHNWSGKEVYKTFLRCENPFVSATVEVNIKNLAQLAKEKHTTVNTLVLYAIGKAVNSNSQFRLRMLAGNLVEFEKSCLSITVPSRKNKDYFNFCNIDYSSDLDEFIKNVNTATKEAKQRNEISPKEYRPDAVFLSHVNGNYNAMNNPNNGKYDFVPRIVWGEPKTKNGETIPLTIEAHHSVLSGQQISKFVKEFQRICDEELKATNTTDT